MLLAKRKFRKIDREVDKTMANARAHAEKAWGGTLKLGALLLEIQSTEAYKEKFKTFEAYLDSKQDIKKSRGYQLIEAHKTALLLEKSVHPSGVGVDTFLPQNERQLRPLTKLSAPEQKVYAWQKAASMATAAGKKTPSRFDVEAAVTELKANPVELEPIEEPDYSFDKPNLTSAKQEILYSPGDNDECYTPAYAVRALLRHLERFRGKTIWCPFDTADSHFVKVLTEEGHDVIFSHISEGQDFYTYEPPIEWDLMVSNPPFTDKRKIFERAVAFGKPFALIMTNTWLNDAAPKQVFRECGLQMLMFDERIHFIDKGKDTTFSSSYFCRDFLKGRDIQFASLKDYGYGK